MFHTKRTPIEFPLSMLVDATQATRRIPHMGSSADIDAVNIHVLVQDEVWDSPNRVVEEGALRLSPLVTGWSLVISAIVGAHGEGSPIR